MVGGGSSRTSFSRRSLLVDACIGRSVTFMLIPKIAYLSGDLYVAATIGEPKRVKGSPRAYLDTRSRERVPGGGCIGSLSAVAQVCGLHHLLLANVFLPQFAHP